MLQSVGDRLAALGATVSDTARPNIDFESSFRTYLELLNAVMASGLPDEAYQALQQQAGQIAQGDDSVDSVWMRAGVQTHRDWLLSNNARELLRMAWREFFEQWDILICPQMATPAFEHDHSSSALTFSKERAIIVDNQVQPYFQQIFWSGIATVAYLPSTVFPTGLSQAGLPIGLQAVGAEFNDYLCIDFAKLLAVEFGGFVPPPGY